MRAGLAQLHTLANLYGVRTAYLDMTNQTRAASAESLLAALKALGAPLTGMADISSAIKEKRREQWLKPLEPVIAVTENEILTVNLKLPAPALNSTVKAVLNLENGQRQDFLWRIEESSVIHSQFIEGKRYYNIRLYLPGMLPMGYHRLALELPGQNIEALTIVSPRKTYQPPPAEKIWGIFAPLYALHSSRSWGAGNFSDLDELLGWTVKLGGRVVGTLPLLAGFFDKHYGPGPYLPASRFFWNDFYLDLQQVPELSGCPEALTMLGNEDFQKNLKELKSSNYINYEQQIRLKRQVLAALSDYFFRDKSQRFNQFITFMKDNPGLSDYAAFREAGEKHGINWNKWPKNGINSHPDKFDQAGPAARYFMYAQWLTETQLGDLIRKAGEANSYLYMDMPVGIHPYSFDVWKTPDIFAREANAGAPPTRSLRTARTGTFPPSTRRTSAVRATAISLKDCVNSFP